MPQSRKSVSIILKIVHVFQPKIDERRDYFRGSAPKLCKDNLVEGSLWKGVSSGETDPTGCCRKCIRLAIPALVWTALEKTHGCNFIGGKV